MYSVPSLALQDPEQNEMQCYLKLWQELAQMILNKSPHSRILTLGHLIKLQAKRWWMSMVSYTNRQPLLKQMVFRLAKVGN